MIYKYLNTFVKICCQSDGTHYSTYRFNPEKGNHHVRVNGKWELRPGEWEALRCKDMPRMTDLFKAMDNLKSWAEEKQLERIDCDVCEHKDGSSCHKYKCQLPSLPISRYEEEYIRCDMCKNSNFNPYYFPDKDNFFGSNTKSRVENLACTSIYLENRKVEQYVTKIVSVVLQRNDIYIKASHTSESHWSFYVCGSGLTSQEYTKLNEVFLKEPDKDFMFQDLRHIENLLAMNIISEILPFKAIEAFALSEGMIFSDRTLTRALN